MRQAFAQTANEASQKPNGNNAAPPAAANNQQPPPRRPTFELLEVKMLRMLQADLNERTRQHEQRWRRPRQPVRQSEPGARGCRTQRSNKGAWPN